jgi:hemoglobin/transferrin/lactoferrin receptor protein
MNCRGLLAASVAAFLAPALSMAEATQAPAGLETITVYGRRIQPITRVAASVTAIDRTSIQSVLATDVREAVRYQPGIAVRNDPFRFGLDSFSIRGIGGNRVAVEIDGIPATEGFAVGSYSDTGRTFIDTMFLERIEILRGPASSLYGSDALGGVVSMQTLDPPQLLEGASQSTGLRTEVGASSDDDGWHAGVIGAGRAGSTDFLLGYVRREGHELETAADVEPNPRDYSSDSILGKVVLGAMPGGPLTVTAEGGRVEQQTDVQAFLGLPGRFVNTVALQGDDEMERYRLSVDQALMETLAFDTAIWRVYAQATETTQLTFEERKAAPPRTPAVAIDRNFRYEGDAVGAEFTAVREAEFGGLSHSFVYGFDLSTTRIEESRDGLQTDLKTGLTTPTILGETFPLRDFPITRVLEAGVFVQDDMELGASGWTLIPALRIDHYRLDPQSDRMYREDNPSAAPVELDETSLAPKLGVTYRVNESATAYFQYARGFRSPPLEDVNIGLEIPLFNIRAIPNPDLEPETSDGYELGLRWRNAAVMLDASAYYSDYTAFIESKVNLGPDPDSGVILFQSRNVAAASIYGVEFRAAVDGSQVAPALRDWNARLAASWAEGRDETADEPLNSIDPPRIVLSLGYAAPSGRWSGELVTTAVAAKDDLDETRVDLYGTDSYLTLDLLARFDLGRGVALNAGVFNLADEDYIEWADVQGRPAGDPLIPYYTRPGRSASVTLHWEF